MSPTAKTHFLFVTTLMLAALAGCVQRQPTVPTPLPPRAAPVISEAGTDQTGLFQLNHSVTVEAIGLAQGLFAEGNFVYVLSDLASREPGEPGPGAIREFFRSTGDDDRPTLRATGRQILLTEDGQDVAPSPTGLTWHPNFGYWLGSSVGDRGSLIQIDFARAIRQGTLDGCVLHEIADDASINGSRPVFVTLPGGRVVLATADGGATNNALRLYDPLALLAADKTSAVGVIYAEQPCGQFVRSLASRGTTGEVWLVQNRSEGSGFRLTSLTLDAQGTIADEQILDFDRPSSALAGLLWLDPNRSEQTPFILVSSHSDQNVHFGRRLAPKRFVNPVRRQLDR
ncbi:MAG: hypothetical protein AAGJ54_07380 [Planctomycetota bacterium]